MHDKLVEALEPCAQIVERNLGRQDEKIADVPVVARRAIDEHRRALASRSDAGVAVEQAKAEAMDEAATYCIETLAKVLGVEDWQIADGSETWDGDVAGTIYNVLKAGRVYDDEDGRVARLEDAHRYRNSDIGEAGREFEWPSEDEFANQTERERIECLKSYYAHRKTVASTKAPDAQAQGEG